jgi:hypothetical protein
VALHEAGAGRGARGVALGAAKPPGPAGPLYLPAPATLRLLQAHRTRFGPPAPCADTAPLPLRPPQEYTGGDVCTLAGGRRAKREVEARFACSPDGKLHMLVREPDFCKYVFVIYSPALCELERYKPRSRKAS